MANQRKKFADIQERIWIAHCLQFRRASSLPMERLGFERPRMEAPNRAITVAYNERRVSDDNREWRVGTRVPPDRTSCRNVNKNGHLRQSASAYQLEAAGIAPASREALVTASTCVAGHLSVSLEAPIGKVPFGLSRHEFNPSRNRWLGSSDPALSSPAASRGRKRGARP
jgi:hypothetical protein